LLLLAPRLDLLINGEEASAEVLDNLALLLGMLVGNLLGAMLLCQLGQLLRQNFLAFGSGVSLSYFQMQFDGRHSCLKGPSQPVISFKYFTFQLIDLLLSVKAPARDDLQA
jgi:hypothetical protein